MTRQELDLRNNFSSFCLFWHCKRVMSCGQELGTYERAEASASIRAHRDLDVNSFESKNRNFSCVTKNIAVEDSTKCLKLTSIFYAWNPSERTDKGAGPSGFG
jgi:hypothetical protein